MAKKKGKGRATTHMTSAERTRAKMRAQQQAEEARREAQQGASGQEVAALVEGGQPPRQASADSQVEDIDAQIAALQRKRAKLTGDAAVSSEDGPTEAHPSGERLAKEKPAPQERRGSREAYPGEKRLRRTQGKLEKQAAAWDSNPLVNRIVCAVIDLFAGGLCLLGPAYLPYYYLSGNNTMSSLSDYVALGQPESLAVALALVGLALGVLYYVIVPWKIWPGQTLGKHLGHIRIVRRSGRLPGLGTLLLRQLVCVMVLELGLTCDLMLLPQLVSLLLGNSDAGTALQSVGLAITAVSVVMFFASRRHLALHDRFAGTRVEQL